MSFSNRVKEDALVKSRRCCCICAEFAGLYVNVHHIVPKAQNGSNTIDNAIVLCLRCHGEVGHYNKQHPIGNKYSESELIKHRDNWWEWCQKNPGVALPKNPISISPSKIDLDYGEWRAKSPLNIYNKGDCFYYQVWIKLGIESDEVQFNQVGIKLIRGHDDTKLKTNHIEISTSVYHMLCHDQAGKKAIFLVIGSIQPHGIYTFEVQQLSSYTESTKQRYITCAISNFCDKPAKTIEGAGKACFNFTPPENLTLISCSLLLRRGI